MTQVSARTTFLHSVALVIGFTAVFTLLGASIGLIGGYVLYDLLPAIVRVGSILLVVFAVRVAHLRLNYWQWGLLALAATAITLVVFNPGVLGALSDILKAPSAYTVALAVDRIEATSSTDLVSSILIGLTVLSGAGWDSFVLAVLAVLVAALSWLTTKSGQGLMVLPFVETVLVGLVVFFGNRTDYFDREMRLDMSGRGSVATYWRSALVGVIFAAGWTPCVGPILAGILMMASQTQTAWQGALLLGAYSIGLGIPFLVAGALFSRLTVYLPRFYRYLPTISIVSGLLLFLIAVLMYTNSLTRLAAYGSFLSLEAGLKVDTEANITLLLAFVAGLVSFLSPCVLPLVPAYLGYLSGATLGAQAAMPGEPAAA